MKDPTAYALDQLFLSVGLVEDVAFAVFHRIYNTADMSLCVSVLKDERSILRVVALYPCKSANMLRVEVWGLGDIEKVRRAFNEVAILGAL